MAKNEWNELTHPAKVGDKVVIKSEKDLIDSGLHPKDMLLNVKCKTFEILKIKKTRGLILYFAINRKFELLTLVNADIKKLMPKRHKRR